MKEDEHFDDAEFDPYNYTKMNGLFTEGTWNCEFVAGFEPQDQDVLLQNRQDFDAFQGTGLEKLLRNANIGTLFIGGFLTNICVQDTTCTADELGFSVYTLTDGCAAKSEMAHFSSTTVTLPLFSKPITCGTAMRLFDPQTRDDEMKAVGISKNIPKKSAISEISKLRRSSFLGIGGRSSLVELQKKVEPSLRLHVATLYHYYPESGSPEGFDPSAKIFFMIGSQRSGSNWLRTMLSEREDLAGMFFFLQLAAQSINDETSHVLTMK